MTWNIVRFGSLIGAAIFVSMSCQPRDVSKPAPPKSNVRNFGEVWAGTSLEHVFSIKNPTTKPLRVVNIQTPSMCTCNVKFLAESDIIPPGGTAELQVKIPTASLGSMKIEKEVVLFTDAMDPDFNTFVFSLTATLVNPVEVFPSHLVFSIIDQPAQYVKDLILHSKIYELQNDMVITSDNPHIRARSIKMSPSRCTIRVEVSPEIPTGDFHGKLFIHIHPELPRPLEVSITGRRAGDIACIPRRVILGKGVGTTADEARLRIYSPTNKLLSIREVKMPVGLHYRQVKSNNPKFLEYAIGFADGSMIRGLEDMMEIVFETPPGARFKVPVTVLK